MQIGGPAARLFRHRDNIGCSYQYDDEQKPCMVFYNITLARTGTSHCPVVVAYLSDLYKYDDDGYLWRVTKEWTMLFRGQYNRFEHRNLFFFANDCLTDLLYIKPFPEQLIERPEIEIAQVDDARFKMTAHGVH